VKDDRGPRVKSKTQLPDINKRLLFASVLASVFACATFALQSLAVISDNSVIAAVQRFFVVLVFPGIIGAMILGANVHAWYLWIAAAINALIYFALGWFIYRLPAWLKFTERSDTPKSSAPEDSL
jgi:hypothetical protein